MTIPRLTLFAMAWALCAPFGGAVAAVDSVSQGPLLSAEDHAAVRCAAAFAIVAGEQERGEPDALAYPPLAWRGGEFLARTGAKLIDAGLSREDAARAFRDGAAALQQEARDAGRAGAVLAAVMPPCLDLLDAEVPPLQTPTLAQCAAILRLSYEEVHEAEGLTPRAKDLLTLASVLEDRRRRALLEEGRTHAEADGELELALDAMRALSRRYTQYDVDHCFELAKPGERKHY